MPYRHLKNLPEPKFSHRNSGSIYWTLSEQSWVPVEVAGVPFLPRAQKYSQDSYRHQRPCHPFTVLIPSSLLCLRDSSPKPSCGISRQSPAFSYPLYKWGHHLQGHRGFNSTVYGKGSEQSTMFMEDLTSQAPFQGVTRNRQ